MNRYKAILIDFDGTLANPHTGEISTKIKGVIQEMLKKNILVSLATGRGYYGRVQEVCHEFGLSAPQIVCGGAEIRNPQDNNVIWSKYLSDSDTLVIVDYLLEKHIYFAIEKEQYVFTPDGTQGIHGPIFIPKKYEKHATHNIPKIIIPSNLNQLSLQDLEQIIDDLEKTCKTIHIIKGKIGDHFGLDITDGGATKHTAALEYMKKMHVEPNEVIGVGDGYNDYPLLTACGTKVAMGDAPEELKGIADLIAPSWENDGLLHVIERYF